MAVRAFLLVFLCGFFVRNNALPEAERFDCYPEHGNQTLCEARGCMWEKSTTKV
jgi:hypothetical protein